MAEHGNYVRRITFPITDELEGDAPEHSHADKDKARRCVDDIHVHVVALLCVIVDWVIDTTVRTVAGVSFFVGASRLLLSEMNGLSGEWKCNVSVAIHPVCSAGR